MQTLLGTTARVDAQRAALGDRAGNPLSVRTELQADCYAGVWANQTNRTTHFLDAGDIDEGLAAASAVGDDTLQHETQGQVTPDSFTHGDIGPAHPLVQARFRRRRHGPVRHLQPGLRPAVSRGLSPRRCGRRWR